MKPVEIEQAIEAAVKRRVEAFVSNVDAKIENILSAALMSLLGIGNSGRGYEIDHCNGRNSVFIDVLRDKARKQVDALLDKVGPATEKRWPDLEEAFAKEYRQQLAYALKTKATERANQKADELAGKMLERILQKNGFPKPEKKA